MYSFLKKLQKKISLMSKNRQVAKENWQNNIKKLEQGIYDESTLQVIESSKGLKRTQVAKRNLSQMIDWNKQKTQNLNSNKDWIE